MTTNFDQSLLVKSPKGNAIDCIVDFHSKHYAGVAIVDAFHRIKNSTRSEKSPVRVTETT